MKQIKDFILSLKDYSPKVLSTSGDCGTVSNVDIIEVNTDFRNHILYIGYESQMQNTIRFLKGVTLFLIEDMDKFSLPKTSGNTVIVYPSETNIEALKKDCLEVIQKQQLIYEDAYNLMETFLSQKDEIAVVEKTAQLIKNPVMLIDTNYKVIAYSKSIPVDDFQWNDNQSRKYCSYEYVSMFSENNAVKKGRGGITPFISGCVASRHRHCITTLKHDGKQQGYLLSIESGEQFTDRSLDILEISGRLLSKIIDINNSISSSTENRDSNSILLDCLSGSFSNSNELDDCLKIIGMGSVGQFYIMAIDIENYRHSIFGKLNSGIEKCMANVSTNIIQTSYHDDVVILIKSDESIKQMEAKLKASEEFFSSNNLRVGVSDAFEDLLSTPKAWEQAKRALCISSGLKVKDCINYYDSFKLYDMIINGVTKDTVKDFIGNECIEIIEYDEKNNTEYFITLYHYIQYNRNLSETSKVLNIHKNTISYRINRVKELFEIDLDIPKLRADVIYAFALLQLQNIDWPE